MSGIFNHRKIEYVPKKTEESPHVSLWIQYSPKDNQETGENVDLHEPW